MRLAAASPLKQHLRTFAALFFLITGVAWIRARLRARAQPLVRVLLVHHVKSQERFAAMVRLLARAYNPISFEDLKERRFDPKRINVLLTFDDGYESWYENGLPVLERYAVPALCFVSSGFVETSGDADAVARFCRERLLLSWTPEPLRPDSLKRLAEHPLITIGGHTRTHPALSQVHGSELAAEIARDREALCTATDMPVSVFAYPFGIHTSEAKEAVRRAGYEFAMTTQEGFYEPGTDPYLIPRSNHGTVHPLFLRLWIWGAFDLVDDVSRLLRGR